MKIAVLAEGPDLSARVGFRFSTSPYLIIIDDETGSFEAISNPGASTQQGKGVQTAVFLLSRGIKQVLVGYCSPVIRNQLKANGVEVLTGIEGSVKDAIGNLKSRTYQNRLENRPATGSYSRISALLFDATRKAARQFVTLLPMLVGVILLMGLLQAFISRELLTSIFTGDLFFDTLWAACAGSIIAGNPINSYIIGGELLKFGISLFAVTAFILTWVTVGIVQLPAEMAALGRKFALIRNGLAFLLSIPTAIISVALLNLFTG